MYLRFFGLRDRPFELTTDTTFLFLTPRQREVLSNLEFGLSAAKPLTVLIGEPGTGKSTLLRAALESDRCRAVECVYIDNPALKRDEFLTVLATRFGLGDAAAASKAVFIQEVEVLLRERRQGGRVMALVIDEAQCLAPDVLEEVRLLGNLEADNQKLLPLVLAGQPDFSTRLENPAFRQLKQRITLRCETAPFDLRETAGYMASRIQRAGGSPSELFTQEAVREIYERSGGVARLVNVVCDNALVSGMALSRKPVDRAIIEEVAHDFMLQPRGDGDERRVRGDAYTRIAPPNSTAMPAERMEEPAHRNGTSDAGRRRSFTVFGKRPS